eukprot:404478-Rhodomonas_salina.2
MSTACFCGMALWQCCGPIHTVRRLAGTVLLYCSMGLRYGPMSTVRRLAGTVPLCYSMGLRYGPMSIVLRLVPGRGGVSSVFPSSRIISRNFVAAYARSVPGIA